MSVDYSSIMLRIIKINWHFEIKSYPLKYMVLDPGSSTSIDSVRHFFFLTKHQLQKQFIYLKRKRKHMKARQIAAGDLQ